MGSEKKVIAVVVAVILAIILAAAGNADMKKTANSAYRKFTSGNYSSMTNSEKAYMNGLLKSVGW